VWRAGAWDACGSWAPPSGVLPERTRRLPVEQVRGTFRRDAQVVRAGPEVARQHGRSGSVQVTALRRLTGAKVGQFTGRGMLDEPRA
jgi:hypothetical protein